MGAHSTGANMEEKADVEMAENPFEPYIESLRQQLEDQDPVFLIGLIVALAVVVITCGKKTLPLAGAQVSMLTLAQQANIRAAS